MGGGNVSSASPEATMSGDSQRAAGISSMSSPLSIQSLLAPSIDEPDAMLQVYTERCVPYFPFGAIPPHETCLRLNDQSPFFLRVLNFLTSALNFERQTALGDVVLREIVERLILRPDKTAEVLMGLLLFSTWNYVMFPINGQMTTLLHLLKSLIVNMQLERAPGSVNIRALFMKGRISPQAVQAARDTTTRTPEQKRALLGCYYLASVK
jgi:hypothetical protein